MAFEPQYEPAEENPQPLAPSLESDQADWILANFIFYSREMNPNHRLSTYLISLKPDASFLGRLLMKWGTVEVPFESLEELGRDDLWDEYIRGVRGLEEAHERPAKKFGIQDPHGGDFLSELRILDPSGESMAFIRRCRLVLKKAEGALGRALEVMPVDWESEDIFQRILSLVDQDKGVVFKAMQSAIRKMKVDNESLPDLIKLSKTESGFNWAVEAIVRVGTPEARATLAAMVGEAADDPARKTQLTEAALAISVKLCDPRVIPLLVDRLVAVYSQGPTDDPYETVDPAKQPQNIIEGLLTVFEHSRMQLPVPMLHQLASLGAVPAEEQAKIDDPTWENPHLGIKQATITRDLGPIRDAARQELDRRRKAS